MDWTGNLPGKSGWRARLCRQKRGFYLHTLVIYLHFSPTAAKVGTRLTLDLESQENSDLTQNVKRVPTFGRGHLQIQLCLQWYLAWAPQMFQ